MGDEWISTVRIARDLGDAALLLPDGIRTIYDLPWPVHEAIQTALMYLAWEEYPSEDRPPRRIWLDMDALKEWFDDVRRRRGTASDSDQDIEDPVQNEFAAELKRKARG